MLVDARKRHVRERVGVVIVEHAVFRDILKARVVALDVGVQPACLVLIAHLGRQYLLGREVFHEVVVDLRRGERHVGRWRLPLISATEVDGVATSGVDADAGLAASVEEVSLLALAIRVVGRETVAHLSLALQRRAANASAYEQLCAVEAKLVSRPCLRAVHEDVVVVAEAVAFLHELWRAAVVEVVERLRGSLGVGADDIIVGVVERGCSHQVFHGLIVHALVGAEVHADVERAA